MTDHDTRVEAARRLIANARPLPGPVADQLDAANRDTTAAFLRAAHITATTEPGATLVVSGPSTDPATREVLARLLASLLACQPCPHLALGPRPAVADLGTGRLDCHQCFDPHRWPPPDDAERCDLCGSRGHHTFRPVTIRLGPVLIVGHAASCCADTIGAKP